MVASDKSIPEEMKQIQVKKLSNNFREATELVQVKVPEPGENQALVRISYVSVNAADILYTAGFHAPGVEPPFAAGLEGMGEIVATGEGSKLEVGQIVVFAKFGSFSEYVVVGDNEATIVASFDPAYLNVPISASTASLALEKRAELKKGENVLVTAAAGATGQFAVQLAKQAGCRVIGTCSTEEKADFLKGIGCDRAVVYTKESLSGVLEKEYPKGVDVVYESVGNELFDTCMKHINVFGRLIVIGATSGYGKEGHLQNATSALQIPLALVQKSASLHGFRLPHYHAEARTHIARLVEQIASGQLKSATDIGERSEQGPFHGIEKIFDAVEYMFAKQNTGKVLVAMNNVANGSKA